MCCRGEGGGGGGEGNPFGGGETSPPDLGAHLWVHTEGPHDGNFAVGVSGEGIKRWGIEGIRIGTSDRFGRGRGEYHQP